MTRTAKQSKAYLSRISCINSGGCLVAAYSFYLAAKKAGRGKNLRLVSLSDTARSFNENKKFLRGNAKKPFPTQHFGWTYNKGKTIFDCKGRVVKENYKHCLVVPKNTTTKFSVATLNQKGWNRSFNRCRYIPRIEKYFGIDLSNILHLH